MIRDNKLKANDWIKLGMKFISGVELMVEVTRKQTFYDLFTGKDKSLPDKLVYEICKAAYIKNRIKTFKDDPKVMVRAAVQAQKTADYIMMHQTDGQP